MIRINILTLILFYLFSSLAAAEEAHFLRAIDGDSILVEVRGLRQEVRLLCVDAPEHDQDPWGDKAREFVNAFCLRGLLDLEFDLDHNDRYNRLLAYVWQGGRMLNVELARAGLAFPAYYKPNRKHLAEIQAAAEEAKAAGSGFYAPDVSIVPPSKWRKRHEKK